MSPRRFLCAIALCAVLLGLLASGAHGAVWVELDDLRVTLHHTDAEWQCAAEIVADIEIGDELITVVERDVALAQADCICDFDLRFGFELPAPGLYHVQLWRGTILVTELWLMVGGTPVGMQATVAQSDCGGWATGIPEPPPPIVPSFSTIKSLY